MKCSKLVSITNISTRTISSCVNQRYSSLINIVKFSSLRCHTNMTIWIISLRSRRVTNIRTTPNFTQYQKTEIRRESNLEEGATVLTFVDELLLNLILKISLVRSITIYLLALTVRRRWGRSRLSGFLLIGVLQSHAIWNL